MKMGVNTAERQMMWYRPFFTVLILFLQKRKNYIFHILKSYFCDTNTQNINYGIYKRI